jgi:hypothetical protein
MSVYSSPSVCVAVTFVSDKRMQLRIEHTPSCRKPVIDKFNEQINLLVPPGQPPGSCSALQSSFRSYTDVTNQAMSEEHFPPGPSKTTHDTNLADSLGLRISVLYSHGHLFRR